MFHSNTSCSLMLASTMLLCWTPADAADALCTPLTPLQKSKNQRYKSEAAQFAIYGILSNNAYGAAHSRIPLPAGWADRTELRSESSPTGLALAVFEKRDNGKLSEVVVAFRGTDMGEDWLQQNLLPLFRKQVQPAEEEFTAILDRYKDQHVRIVATGHSLGGGLAFHMSFVHQGIDAIAFNSSPVTKAGIRIIKGNHRTSIWESGEGLQLPRNAVNVSRRRWKDTRRVEFRFLRGSPFTQHGVEELALSLIRLGASTSTELSEFLARECTR